VRRVNRRLPTNSTFVTAATGVAAVNIGGTTIHSFAGIGIGEQSKEELADLVYHSERHRDNWNKCKVLIMDEISMVDAALFEKLEYVSRIVRGNQYPFGGIQLILSGDFFQLPPIQRSGSEGPLFCFESPQWPRCIQSVIELQSVFRQSDPKFIELLNEIRHGIVTQRTKEILAGCKDRDFSRDGMKIEPTIIYPYNRDVDDINMHRLSDIKAKGKLYRSKDKGKSPHLEALQSHCPAPAELRLKVGAQVILLKNSKRKRLVNGLRGVIIGFDDTKRGFPRVFFGNGEESTVEPERWSIEVNGQEVAFREQVPLKLAWAISIHKCQGMSISACQLSLQGVFEYGQSYVALSRVASLDGLHLIDFRDSSVRAHPKVLEFYETFGGNDGKKWREGREEETTIRAEYALSDRSVCRKCKEKIQKGELRVGKTIESKTHEGKISLWMHLLCFFSQKGHEHHSRLQIQSTAQIGGYTKLRKEDKEDLRGRLKVEEPVEKSVRGIIPGDPLDLDEDDLASFYNDPPSIHLSKGEEVQKKEETESSEKKEGEPSEKETETKTGEGGKKRARIYQLKGEKKDTTRQETVFRQPAVPPNKTADLQTKPFCSPAVEKRVYTEEEKERHRKAFEERERMEREEEREGEEGDTIPQTLFTPSQRPPPKKEKPALFLTSLKTKKEKEVSVKRESHKRERESEEGYISEEEKGSRKKRAVKEGKAKEREGKREEKKKETKKKRQKITMDNTPDVDDLIDELDDENLFGNYREVRIAELKRQAQQNRSLKESGHGQYLEIEREKEFLDISTKTKRVTLAPKHFETKFIKMNVENAPFCVQKLGIKMLPCIICFIDSKSEDRIVGFDELGNRDDFKTSTLEARLSHSGVIFMKETQEQATSIFGFKKKDSDDESDDE
ncbi:ATP-dependent DNA helicase PIF1-like, partial [Planoprotostelium fungivorum]